MRLYLSGFGLPTAPAWPIFSHGPHEFSFSDLQRPILCLPSLIPLPVLRLLALRHLVYLYDLISLLPSVTPPSKIPFWSEKDMRN